MRNSLRSASELRASSTMKFTASAAKFFVRIISRPMHSNRAMRLAAFLQIALMIFFRAPEFRRRLDLRHDRPAKTSALANLFFGCVCRCLLPERMIEDRGAILRADIGPLAIQRGWIVIGPRNTNQFIVSNIRRNEL